jgi:hypothetical protein
MTQRPFKVLLGRLLVDIVSTQYLHTDIQFFCDYINPLQSYLQAAEMC